jgi:hypothetical protein
MGCVLILMIRIENKVVQSSKIRPSIYIYSMRRIQMTHQEVIIPASRVHMQTWMTTAEYVEFEKFMQRVGWKNRSAAMKSAIRYAMKNFEPEAV